MILCEKLDEENIRCSILVSDGEESAVVHWNGEDFVCTTSSAVCDIMMSDEMIMDRFNECLEKGFVDCGSYKMEIMG